MKLTAHRAKIVSNCLIAGSLLFLSLCCLIWKTDSQYNLGFVTPPTLNKLAVIAVVLLVLGTLSSRHYAVAYDKSSEALRKVGFFVLIALGIGFIAFWIMIFSWALAVGGIGS